MISKKYIDTLFSALNKKQKIKMLLFGFFVLILTFLESFGIGMFYPFLQSITDNEINPNIYRAYESVQKVFNLNLDIEVLSILIVAIIIISKNIFSYFFEYWQINFLNGSLTSWRPKSRSAFVKKRAYKRCRQACSMPPM